VLKTVVLPDPARPTMAICIGEVSPLRRVAAGLPSAGQWQVRGGRKFPAISAPGDPSAGFVGRGPAQTPRRLPRISREGLTWPFRLLPATTQPRPRRATPSFGRKPPTTGECLRCGRSRRDPARRGTAPLSRRGHCPWITAARSSPVPASSTADSLPFGPANVTRQTWRSASNAHRAGDAGSKGAL
jgi:hypothetical protein